jgi:hypothetical protein
VEGVKGVSTVKVIVNSIHLTHAWGPCGAGNDIVKGLTHGATAQLIDDGVFADATWT